MIPTRYKVKLPRQMAYAVGAQAVSLALAGVPQEAHLRLCFSFRNFQGALEVQPQPRRVLSASYYFWRQPRFAPDIRDVGAHWDIDVGAVRREDAALVRELIQQDGLPRVRAWFLSHAHQTDDQAPPASIHLLFSEAESTLVCQHSVRLA